MRICSNPDDYTPEAEEASRRLLNKRGGIEAASERIHQRRVAAANLARENWKAVAAVEAEDRKIKPRTIFGSIIGVILASIVGTILWTVQLLYAGGYIAEKITFVLGAGLFFVCYGIVKATTGQSKKNVLVFLSSVIAVAVSIIVGHYLCYDTTIFHLRLN